MGNQWEILFLSQKRSSWWHEQRRIWKLNLRLLRNNICSVVIQSVFPLNKNWKLQRRLVRGSWVKLFVKGMHIVNFHWQKKKSLARWYHVHLNSIYEQNLWSHSWFWRMSCYNNVKWSFQWFSSNLMSLKSQFIDE